MPKRGSAVDLVVGSNKLRDWKGQLPVRVSKMIAAYAVYYNDKNGLTGDDRVTEGDVVASVIVSTFGENDEFVKKFEAGELDGGVGPADAVAGKRAAGRRTAAGDETK